VSDDRGAIPAHEAADAVLSDPNERAVADERRTGRDQARLGVVLRDARERAGLGLSDLAEVTHVRSVYLVALEEGRYPDLPEDVYSRNFVRLYASAVGLEAAPLLEQYARERQLALGRTTLEQRLERDRAAATQLRRAPTAPVVTTRSWTVPAWLLGPWLPTLALVVVVVGLAVWGYNSLFGAASVTPSTTPTSAATTATPDATPTPAAAGADATAAAPAASLAAPTAATAEATATQVRISVVTTPPGAAITIDGFPVPGVTPLVDIPVTAREGRLVRAELDGYEPAELRADLRQDADLSLSLTAVADPASPPAGAAGTLTITVTDTTWLEVYRSTARNEGERLVYTTAQAGASYSFAPPLFVYTGNAAGVRLNLDGQDLGPMGSPGAVLGRAFPQ